MNQPAIGIGICGDKHLKPSLMGRKELYGDSYAAALEVRRRVQALNLVEIDGGDMFDSPEPDTVSRIFAQGLLDGVYDGLRPQAMLGVIGNHDSATIDSPAPQWLLRGFESLHGNLVEPVPGLRVYGINGHRGREKELLKAELAKVPLGTDVLVLHQLAKSSAPFENAWNFDEDWVPDHVPLVVMSDNHKPLDYTDSRGIRFVYTGSSYMTAAGEDPDKSFVVVTRAPDGSLDVRREPIRTRVWLDVPIRSGMELDAFLAGLPHRLTQAEAVNADFVPFRVHPDHDRYVDIRKPMLRVRYAAEIQDVEGKSTADRIKGVVAGRAHVELIPVSIEMGDEAFVYAPDADVELSVEEVLRTLPIVADDPALMSLASDVLKTPVDKVEEVLRRLAAEHRYTPSWAK